MRRKCDAIYIEPNLVSKVNTWERSIRAETDIDRAPVRMRKSVLGVLFFTAVLTTVSIFFAAQHYFERLEGEAASNRMLLYQRALDETLR
ncbi:MAG: hypothetical protein ACI84R_001272 [Candidatus Azotimanducaceae bacterium]